MENHPQVGTGNVCTACEHGRMGTQINVSGRYNRLFKQLAERVHAMGVLALCCSRGVLAWGSPCHGIFEQRVLREVDEREESEHWM